jgi:lysophospholipase L1-like esterase
MLNTIKIALYLLVVFPLFVSAQIRTEEKVRFLALGDSYTIGQSVSINERWPVQLIDSLKAKGISCFDPQIIATTGWRTDNLKAAIQDANLSNSYNLVSLLIGVNNYYQGGSVSAYVPEFEELLDIAIDLAGGDKDHVFVVSIPDYGYTPFGISNQPAISAGINTFNNANKSITEGNGVTYIEITDISRLGIQQPELVAADGLHPSGKMYTQWVRRILDKITVQEVITRTHTTELWLSIKIYPNPSSTTMMIENLPVSENTFSMIFHGSSGTAALSMHFVSQTRKAQIDITDLVPGTYFYQLSGKTGVLKTGKLVRR